MKKSKDFLPDRVSRLSVDDRDRNVGIARFDKVILELGHEVSRMLVTFEVTDGLAASEIIGHIRIFWVAQPLYISIYDALYH